MEMKMPKPMDESYKMLINGKWVDSPVTARPASPIARPMGNFSPVFRKPPKKM